MRVALVTEDGYPYRENTGATWCRRLVLGLSDHEIHLVGVVNGPAPQTSSSPAPTPPAVASLTPVPLAGRGNSPADGPIALQHRRFATHAAVLLCRGMLDDAPHSAAMFRSAMRRLAGIAADGTHPLSGVPLAAVLLDAWRANTGAETPTAGHTPPTALPHPTLRDGQLAADLIAAATRALSIRVPPADVCQVVGGGLGVLVALGALWRQGMPYVLTEYERYQCCPLAGRAGARPAVRAVILRFLRALTKLAYAEAAIVAPDGERMRRWVAHHGADPARTVMVPLGVAARDHPRLRDDPIGPVLAWLGSDHELPMMLRAHRAIRRQVPDSRLLVIGAGPVRNAASVPDGVNFTGPVTAHRALFGMARAVVLSGAADLMPYPLIEAMLCGRPVVCVEPGRLAELIEGTTVLVPGGDPARLAASCSRLLTDDRLRRDLSESARARARVMFGDDAMIDRYREVYARAAATRPACASALLGASTSTDANVSMGTGTDVSRDTGASVSTGTGRSTAGAGTMAPSTELPAQPWQPRLARLPEIDDPTDPLSLTIDRPTSSGREPAS